MDLVGEINRLAGVAVVDRMGLAGACNLWAGTTGLEAVGALNVRAGLVPNGTALELNGVLKRLGFDLDSNGALVGGTDGTTNVANVLRLPGVSGNYVATPDNSAVSITGDIDLRWKGALDNWGAGAAAQDLISKWNATGNQRSFVLQINVTGNLAMVWSNDGIASNVKVSNSLVNTTVANGAVKWVRATLTVATGATSFYTSDDGVNWTTLGDPAAFGATSIFDSTAEVEIGALVSSGRYAAGRVYYAEIRSGIGGNVVASFDSSTVAVRGDQLPTTVQSVPFNLLTANEADVETDLTGIGATGGTNARITSDFNTGAASVEHTTGAGANPSVFLGNGQLGGSATNWDFPVVPGQTYSFVGYTKFPSYVGTMQIKIAWYTSANVFISQATGNFTGSAAWTLRTISGIAPATAAYAVPYFTFSGTPGASTVGRFDTMAFYKGTVAYWTPPTTWTVNGTAWWWDVYGGTKRYTNSIRLPGTAGNYVSTPDSVALSITGDIDLRAKVAMDNWTPSVDRGLFSKYNTTGNQRSYRIYLNGSGNFLAFAYSADGTTPVLTNGWALTYAPGTTKWVRVTMAVATGQKIFYDSDDGVTWTTKATVAGAATSIFDGTAPLEIGTRNDGAAEPWPGAVYYAEVRNGIGGTVVASFNPDALRITGPQTPSSWTGSAGNVWTVNGTGWNWVTA